DMAPIGPLRVPYLVALLALGLALAVAPFPEPEDRKPVVECRGCVPGPAHTRFRMRDVAEALEHYGIDHADQRPWSMSGLVDQRYRARPAKDAWGTPIAFTCTSPFAPGHALIVSAGPDRKFGTPDDLRDQ